MKKRPNSRLIRYTFAILVTAITLIISALLQALLVQNRFLLFVGAVALSAWFGGLGPGLLSTLLSLVVVDYFLFTPLALFALADVPRFALFASVAILISYLTENQRRAEKEVDEQREWLQTTLASIGDGVIAADVNGQITFLNGVAETLTGWHQAEAMGKDVAQVFNIVNALTRLPGENPVTKVLREGVVVGLANNTILLAKDGKEIPIDDSGAPIRNATKNISGAVLVFRDVTQQQRARRLEAQLAAIVKSSDDAILGLDLNGSIISWNIGAERMYGYTAEEMIGKPIMQLIPEGWPDDVLLILDRIRRGELVEHYETRRMRKDGNVLDVSLTVSPIFDAEGVLVGVSKIARDITTRKRAENTQHFLTEITRVLTSSIEYDSILKGLAQLMVPSLADWCSVHVLDESGHLRTVDVVVSNPEILVTLAELRQRYPFNPSATEGIAQAIRTGQTIYHPEIASSVVDRYSRDQEHRRLIVKLGIKSSIIVPLRARERVLGVISLNISEGSRRYNEDDLATAEEVARRAAIALDNAQLYGDAQEARRSAEETANRIARLQTLTAALSESLTPAEVASVIINQGLGVLGAAAGSVELLDADRFTIRLINSIGYPAQQLEEWRTFSLSSVGIIAESVRTGKAIWLESRQARAELYPELMEGKFAQTDHSAWAALPLLVEGQAIGALGLSFANAQQFSERDRTFMMTLAHHCAQAIHRARLYEAEQRALTAAEAAIRVRDEFLSVAAHELRTPITSLRGFGQMLSRQMDRDGAPDPTRLRKVLEAVDLQSIKLTALVSQLLDISRLEAGRLVLERHLTDITPLVQEAVNRAQTTYRPMYRSMLMNCDWSRC